MSLVLDARRQGTPGLHAFVCGVSAYNHLPGGSGARADRTFGLQQLSSTATTAFLFYEWLLRADREGRLPLPLATVHLLLSPAAAELAQRPAMTAAGPAGTAPGAATRRNFSTDARAWREAAGASDEEITFFYYAGHGVQRKQKDSVLLLADFGDPPAGGPLVNTVDANHLIAGMAPPRNAAKRIARRQVYFVDACRMPVGEFQQHEWQNVPDLWPVELNGLDDRAAPVFHASLPGASAFAVGGGQTLFSQALFDCLDRLGGVPPKAEEADARWRVTTFSLIQSLEGAIAGVNAEHGAEQDFGATGQLRDVPLVFLPAVPEVEVDLRIDPDAAAPLFRVEVSDHEDRPARTIDDPAAGLPWSFRLPAGLYSFDARLRQPPHPPYRDRRRKLATVNLPRCPVKVEVQGP